MDPERWKKIDEIFHAVLDREPSARAAYLEEACKGDDQLRLEIEGLIASHEKESTFLENPGADLAAEILAKQGTHKGSIAHYRIIKKIGSGGMGEVYLAEDSRLNRKVALKLLPSEFTKDKERIRRFEREARSVSALNHPNILTIYDIGQVDSSSFIASEYIDGETLRQKIRASKIALKEILTIGVQVAEALDAAHQAGIIHRDIKPENIMLRKDGYVKVLDFGLAKLIETRSALNVSDIETRTSPDTQPGIVVGTVKYMSPEQARGLKVDTRSDIFSLGVVLYEMIAQRPPFDGATSSDVLAAILEKHPPLIRTYGEFPEELQWIITKALAKDVDERYQAAKELVTDLKRIRKKLEVSEEFRDSNPAFPVKERIKPKFQARKLLLFLCVAAVILIGAVATFQFFSKRNSSPIKNESPNQKQITFTGMANNPEISPDGKFVAYYEPSGQVFVQSLTDGKPLSVFKSEGAVHRIRWSPDGSQLLVRTTSRFGAMQSFIVTPFGGQTRPIPIVGYLMCWSPDAGRLGTAFQDSKEIKITDINDPSKTTKINILPREFLFLLDFDWSKTGRFALLLRTDTKSLISTMKEDGSQPEILVTEAVGAIQGFRWSWDSKAIYYWKQVKDHQSELMKIEISPDTGKPLKNPKVVLSYPDSTSGISFSRNGILAFRRAVHKSNLWTLHLNDSNQKWSQNPLTQGTWDVSYPSVSPDGTTIAFTLTKGGNSSINTLPITGGEMQQLTFGEQECLRAAWSPSGKTISAFCKNGDVLNLVLISLEGSILRRFESTKIGSSSVTWAPGNSILYQILGNKNYHFLDPTTGKEKPLLPDVSRGWVFEALVSPDQKKAVFTVNWPDEKQLGIWLENLSDHSGTLLVRSHPDEVGDPIGWSSDSKYIYLPRYLDDTNVVVSKVSIDTKKEKQLPRLHFGEDKYINWISMAQDENTFAAAVSDYEADVWIVDNFDPEFQPNLPAD